MKLFVSALILIAGLSAQAQIIKGSTLEERHQKAIAAAIKNTCSITRNLTQISQIEETVAVDQGIRDIYYTTIIDGEFRLDQDMFDHYTITVHSLLADIYDHQNQTWGVFVVEKVSCELVQ